MVMQVPSRQTTATVSPAGARTPRGRDLSNLAAAAGAPQAAAAQQRADALSQMGTTLLDEHAKRQARHDAIARADDLGIAQQRIKELVVNEQQAGTNFSGPDAVGNFAASTNEVVAEVLANHRGTPESRMILAEQLTRERHRFQDFATTQAVNAAQARVQQQFGDFASQMADMAFNAPEAIPDLFEEINVRVANYEASLTPEQAEAMRRAARSQVVNAAMDSHLATGDIQTARTLLGQSTDFLDPDEQRRIRIRIVTQEVEQEKRNSEVLARRKRLEEAGVNVSDPRIALAIEGIQLPASSAAMTPPQKIQELERIIGPENVTPDMRAKAFGMYIAEGREPQGTAGERQRTRLVSQAAAFAAGAMEPEQAQAYLADALDSVQPRIDPATGTMVHPSLAPAARNALAQLGVDVNRFLGEPAYQQAVSEQFGLGVGIGAPQPQVQPGVQPQPQAPPEQPGVEPPPLEFPRTGLDLGDGASAEREGEIPAEPQTPEQEEQLAQELARPEITNIGALMALPERELGEALEGAITQSMETGAPPAFNLWDSASALVTPLSTLERLGRRLPWVADMVAGDVPEGVGATYAGARAEAIERQLARMLQESPRFAQMEYAQILDSVRLGPQTMQSVGGYRQHLLAQADQIHSMMREAQDELMAGQISMDRRQNLMDRVAGGASLLRLLGAPVTAHTTEAAAEIPPGVPYRMGGRGPIYEN